MLLLIEVIVWVEAEAMSEHRDADIRHPSRPRFSDGEDQKLRNVRLNGDSRLTNIKELVDESAKDNEGDTQNPNPNGHDLRSVSEYLVPVDMKQPHG